MTQTSETELGLSTETAEFLLFLVNQVTLSADDPRFAEMAAKIVQAKKELEEIAHSRN